MWIFRSNQKELHRGGTVNINALTKTVVRCAGVDKAALGHHFQSEFPGFCSFQLPTLQSSCHLHISSASLLCFSGQPFSLLHLKIQGGKTLLLGND